MHLCTFLHLTHAVKYMMKFSGLEFLVKQYVGLIPLIWLHKFSDFYIYRSTFVHLSCALTSFDDCIDRGGCTSRPSASGNFQVSEHEITILVATLNNFSLPDWTEPVLYQLHSFPLNFFFSSSKNQFLTSDWRVASPLVTSTYSAWCVKPSLLRSRVDFECSSLEFYAKDDQNT